MTPKRRDAPKRKAGPDELKTLKKLKPEPSEEKRQQSSLQGKTFIPGNEIANKESTRSPFQRRISPQASTRSGSISNEGENFIPWNVKPLKRPLSPQPTTSAGIDEHPGKRFAFWRCRSLGEKKVMIAEDSGSSSTDSASQFSRDTEEYERPCRLGELDRKTCIHGSEIANKETNKSPLERPISPQPSTSSGIFSSAGKRFASCTCRSLVEKRIMIADEYGKPFDSDSSSSTESDSQFSTDTEEYERSSSSRGEHNRGTPEASVSEDELGASLGSINLGGKDRKSIGAISCETVNEGYPLKDSGDEIDLYKFD